MNSNGIYLYVDIETRAIHRKAWQVKNPTFNPQDPDQWDDYLATAKNHMYCTVLCISAALGNDEVQTFFHAEDEAEVLRQFDDWLALRARAWITLQANDRFPQSYKEKTRLGFTWVSHNGCEFDYPILAHRAMRYKCSNILRSLPDRKWDPRNVDTMVKWAGTATSPQMRYTKLDDIAAFLGIPGKSGLPSSWVPQAAEDGDFSTIKSRAAQDVEILRQVHKRMTGEHDHDTGGDVEQRPIYDPLYSTSTPFGDDRRLSNGGPEAGGGRAGQPVRDDHLNAVLPDHLEGTGAAGERGDNE